MKEDRSFSEFVQHHELTNFGTEYFKYPHSQNLETSISELFIKRAFRKCIRLLLDPFVVSELQLIEVKRVRKQRDFIV